MTTINNGGPAFPSDRTKNTSEGMTLRDYFASRVLPAAYKDYCETAREDGWDPGWRDYVAQESYKMADAMLNARGAA